MQKLPKNDRSSQQATAKYREVLKQEKELKENKEKQKHEEEAKKENWRNVRLNRDHLQATWTS